MVNVGSLGSIATTLMERYIGFWSAYLLDLCAVVVCVLVVQVASSCFGEFGGLRCGNSGNSNDTVMLVHPPTQGSKLPLAARCLWCAARGGFNLDAALPQRQLELHGRVVPWDKEFIKELRGALSAFKIWLVLLKAIRLIASIDKSL
jgi:POT family proton-dependent oligopeptide transporter